MSRLHLVRHGETDWNAQKRYQGSIDIPLNERGRLQARTTGDALAEHPFTAIYVSPLSRAVETAEIIKGSRPLPITIYEELREIAFGSLEGKTLAEVHKELKLESTSSKEKFLQKIVPDMESGKETVDRVLPTLLTIANRHPDEDILIVTHGGVIHSLLSHLAGFDWSDFRVGNGEVFTFHHEGDTLKYESIHTDPKK